jgi:hypothetical protein
LIHVLEIGLLFQIVFNEIVFYFPRIALHLIGLPKRVKAPFWPKLEFHPGAVTFGITPSEQNSVFFLLGNVGKAGIELIIENAIAVFDLTD